MTGLILGRPVTARPKRDKKFVSMRKVLSAGAPEEIRTPDPQIRSLVLYPAELRARFSRAFRGARPGHPACIRKTFSEVAKARHSYRLRAGLARSDPGASEQHSGRNSGRNPRNAAMIGGFHAGAAFAVIVREGGRSSNPRHLDAISKAAAYWIPRLRGV